MIVQSILRYIKVRTMDNLVWWIMVVLFLLGGISNAYEAGKGDENKIIGALFKVGLAVWGILTLVS